MARTVTESELFYEQVKHFFWRKEEADFIVRFSDAPMEDWEIIPTPSTDDMMTLRFHFYEDGVEYAGFIRHEGRYCFYFVDQNIVKVQYLDNGEIDCFDVHVFSELNLEKVAEEFRMLLQQMDQGS